MIRFEAVGEGHLQALADIYNDFIATTTALFFEEPVTAADMRGMTAFDGDRFGAFAVMDGARVVGHLAVKPHSPRSSYGRTADVTVILARDYTGRGLGATCLSFLEGLAKERGFHTLLAVISGENAASVAFFAKHGYAACGLMKEVGYKFGRYLDVVIYQKML